MCVFTPCLWLAYAVAVDFFFGPTVFYALGSFEESVYFISSRVSMFDGMKTKGHTLEM